MDGPARALFVAVVIAVLIGSTVFIARATCTTDGWRCLDQGSIVNGGKMK